jgi:hypothetical protein
MECMKPMLQLLQVTLILLLLGRCCGWVTVLLLLLLGQV